MTSGPSRAPTSSTSGAGARSVASAFLAWLGMPAGSRWLDVGCGAVALSQSILGLADPARVVGIDASIPFVSYTNRRTADPRIRFMVGDAELLPVATGSFDCIVSGLMLNFVPNPHAAIAEMARVSCAPEWIGRPCRLGLRRRHAADARFWDSAAALDAAAARSGSEGRRFPCAGPMPLKNSCTKPVSVRAVSPLDVPTVFRISTITGHRSSRQGPAPGYAMSLSGERRTSLREHIRASPTKPMARSRLVARGAFADASHRIRIATSACSWKRDSVPQVRDASCPGRVSVRGAGSSLRIRAARGPTATSPGRVSRRAPVAPRGSRSPSRCHQIRAPACWSHSLSGPGISPGCCYGCGGSQSVLHLPNLVFHEAGHVFAPFGQFVACSAEASSNLLCRWRSR